MVRLAAPGVGERGDEEQTASGLAVPVTARRRFGQAVAPGVRDLDAQGAGREGQGETGVAAWHAAAQGGVRGEFRDEEGSGGGGEVQHISRLITDPDEVRILAARYGSIRAQALTPEESLTLIEKMLGDR